MDLNSGKRLLSQIVGDPFVADKAQDNSSDSDVALIVDLPEIHFPNLLESTTT